MKFTRPDLSHQLNCYRIQNSDQHIRKGKHQSQRSQETRPDHANRYPCQKHPLRRRRSVITSFTVPAGNHSFNKEISSPHNCLCGFSWDWLPTPISVEMEEEIRSTSTISCCPLAISRSLCNLPPQILVEGNS